MKELCLSRFTPSLMQPKALEEVFVQRQQLAEQLLKLIRDSVLQPTKHYTLLVGPRGIGKTHLVSLIYHRVRQMNDLSQHLLIAWLREEEWGVMSFLDLLLRIFRSLQEEYNDTQLTDQVESLYELPSVAAERAAAALLKEVIGNRTLLLLVENLDEVFAGLGIEGQQQLRAYLQENAFCTILATAQSLFNGIKLQTSPFYGFFRIRHLKELTPDEATQLLTNIAKLEGNSKLESFIQTPTGRARIKAVHHLAGGNHRVYIIFSQFLTRESLDQLVEAFMRTLDDLTPYYQARIAWLSPQQRKIIEVLCDRRHAVTVKEIAQRCFITHQTASSQLKDLREKGYVASESAGRESYYELREPLMRFCLDVKKQRGEPIRLFVTFLRLWCTRQELYLRLVSLPTNASLEREYVLHALWATSEEKDLQVATLIKDYSDYVEKNDFAHALQVVEKLAAIRGHAEDLLVLTSCLMDSERWDEIIALLDKVIELDPNLDPAWSLKGILLIQIGNYEKALESLDKTIELNPTSWITRSRRGAVMLRTGRFLEALADLDQAIELYPSDDLTWRNRGITLVLLDRYDEALESLNKAIELDPKNGLDWGIGGIVLCILGSYEEAITYFNKSIELGCQDFTISFNRAKLLLALNRWEEGSTALEEAFESIVLADELVAGGTEEIVQNLFKSTHDVEVWRSRVIILIQLYAKHQIISGLGKGLVTSISELASPMVSDVAARQWRDVWRELTSDYPEFQIPIRLLNTAVRYRETEGNPRVLLELPTEERRLLRQLLGLEE